MATYYGENSIIKQDKSGLNFGPNFAAKLHSGGGGEVPSILHQRDTALQKNPFYILAK